MTHGVNFARRPFRNQRLPRLVIGSVTVAVGALSFAHVLMLTPYLMRETQGELDDKVSKLAKEVEALEQSIAATREEVASPRSAATDLRVRFVASLFRQRGFSWTGFFNALEELTPANVRILSIAPAVKEANEASIEVKLAVVGRSLEDVLDMVKKLEDSEAFGSVLPSTEGEFDEQKGGGVGATLDFLYFPGTSKPPVEKVAEQGNPVGQD